MATRRHARTARGMCSREVPKERRFSTAAVPTRDAPIFFVEARCAHVLLFGGGWKPPLLEAEAITGGAGFTSPVFGFPNRSGCDLANGCPPAIRSASV